MKYGDSYETSFRNPWTGERIVCSEIYREVEWRDYKTGKDGEGLWYWNGYEYKQILGTCQFSVCGCKTEKAAKAKIRRYITGR